MATAGGGRGASTTDNTVASEREARGGTTSAGNVTVTIAAQRQGEGVNHGEGNQSALVPQQQEAQPRVTRPGPREGATASSRAQTRGTHGRRRVDR